MRQHIAALVTLALGLAACVAEPELRAPDRPQLLVARRVLAEAAQRGPVPLELHRPPAHLAPERIAELAALGVPALRPQLVLAEAARGTRLRLIFGEPEPVPAGPCAALPADGPAPPPVELTAVLCEGAEAIAMVHGRAAGPTAADTERLIWRTTGRLFPDDYPETYGFNLFGSWLRIGLGGSFGF